jgi:hypothetical protein
MCFVSYFQMSSLEKRLGIKRKRRVLPSWSSARIYRRKKQEQPNKSKESFDVPDVANPAVTNTTTCVTTTSTTTTTTNLPATTISLVPIHSVKLRWPSSKTTAPVKLQSPPPVVEWWTY